MVIPWYRPTRHVYIVSHDNTMEFVFIELDAKISNLPENIQCNAIKNEIISRKFKRICDQLVAG